jgi:hypothetical protein
MGIGSVDPPPMQLHAMPALGSAAQVVLADAAPPALQESDSVSGSSAVKPFEHEVGAMSPACVNGAERSSTLQPRKSDAAARSSASVNAEKEWVAPETLDALAAAPPMAPHTGEPVGCLKRRSPFCVVTWPRGTGSDTRTAFEKGRLSGSIRYALPSARSPAGKVPIEVFCTANRVGVATAPAGTVSTTPSGVVSVPPSGPPKRRSS